MPRWSILAVLVAACASPTAPIAEPWPALERLFRSDPRWRGGDAAYSVDLGNGSTLWLFGDSFVARPYSDGRRGCAMVRNSIAVQTGVEPRTATIAFAWRSTLAQPASWFQEDGDVWHWPLHGVRVGDAVTVFATRVRSTGEPGPFGFRAVGWTAFRITGVDGPIDAWRCERLATPDAPFPVVVGTAVLALGAHVLAYALREPGDHAVFLARWPRDAFARGDLESPEWFDAGRWRPHAELRAAPTPVLAEGAPEFTVHRALDGYAMVQTVGFGAADLAVRTAPAPEGPWSEPRVVYRSPESDRDGVFVYAGKAHPHLGGERLGATFASNAWDFGRLVSDESLYFPHCVLLQR
jgi:hypothetical protein